MKTMLNLLFILLFPINLLSQSSDTIFLETIQFDFEDYEPFLGIRESKVFTKQNQLINSISIHHQEKFRKKQLKNFDFDLNTFIGINLSTGWCRAPEGLDFKGYKIDKANEYLLVISYIKPIEPCRALSSYDLWLKVPKLPLGYNVRFQFNILDNN